jgi:hypothetical protein
MEVSLRKMEASLRKGEKFLYQTLHDVKLYEMQQGERRRRLK